MDHIGELAAERTVTMILMHTIIGMTADMARATGDPTLIDDVVNGLRETVMQVGAAADVAELTGSSASADDVVACARQRALNIAGAIEMGARQALAEMKTARH